MRVGTVSSGLRATRSITRARSWLPMVAQRLDSVICCDQHVRRNASRAVKDYSEYLPRIQCRDPASRKLPQPSTDGELG